MGPSDDRGGAVPLDGGGGTGSTVVPPRRSSRTGAHPYREDVQPGWIEQRRGTDGERLGWIVPRGDGFVAIDLCGRARSDEVDWFTAESTLEELGLGYLAAPYELRLASGEWLRVRLAEVSTDRIRLVRDDWGTNAIGADHQRYEISFGDAAESLRPCSP